MFGCDAIFAFTQSGASAATVARERPHAPIFGVSPYAAAARRMALIWGVQPMTRPAPDTFDAAIEQARALMREIDDVENGLLVGGLPFGSEGRTNVLHLLNL